MISKLGNKVFEKVKFNCLDSGLRKEYYFIEECNDDTSLSKKERRKAENYRKEELKLTSALPIDEYVISYTLNLSQNIIYPFQVKMDVNGKLKGNLEIPDCSIDPKLCNLKVDSLSAIALASKLGFIRGLGLKGSKVKYIPKFGRFFWEVKTELSTNRGEAIYLDAITGEYNKSLDAQWRRVVVN